MIERIQRIDIFLQNGKAREIEHCIFEYELISEKGNFGILKQEKYGQMVLDWKCEQELVFMGFDTKQSGNMYLNYGQKIQVTT